jgi:hypothetical protein
MPGLCALLCLAVPMLGVPCSGPAPRCRLGDRAGEGSRCLMPPVEAQRAGWAGGLWLTLRPLPAGLKTPQPLLFSSTRASMVSAGLRHGGRSGVSPRQSTSRPARLRLSPLTHTPHGPVCAPVWRRQGSRQGWQGGQGWQGRVRQAPATVAIVEGRPPGTGTTPLAALLPIPRPSLSRGIPRPSLSRGVML